MTQIYVDIEGSQRLVRRLHEQEV